MGEERGPVVELHHISKRFPGVQALDDVSLTVFPGEIHALIGENGAGKSTLMNVLAGELQPDEGQIIFDGRPCEIPNAAVSQQLGISVVFQELALCPNLSIAENVSLNRVATIPGIAIVNRRAFAERARIVLSTLGLETIDLNTPAGELTVAQQQLVEIAKAISSEVKLLILDEPNSALTQDETAHLFAVLRQLKTVGVGIIYVSHRLEEVLSLADKITVLRDGKFIETLDASVATINGLIARMVGREVASLFHRDAAATIGDQVVLEARQLSSGPALQDVSFHVHAGEIVGIAGLPDAGKDDLVECCFGLRAYEGQIEIRGEPVHLGSPSTAIQHGLAFIPADRRHAGALLVMNVEDNVAAASLKEVSWLGVLRRRRHARTEPRICRQAGRARLKPGPADGNFERRKSTESHPGTGHGYQAPGAYPP